MGGKDETDKNLNLQSPRRTSLDFHSQPDGSSIGQWLLTTNGFAPRLAPHLDVYDFRFVVVFRERLHCSLNPPGPLLVTICNKQKSFSGKLKTPG